MYKIIFTSQSVINELPNSQTIFGALCTILLQTQNEEIFKEYIESFKEQPKFIHSSMFLNGTLPMVKQSLFSLDDVNEMVSVSASSEKLKILESTKKYKKISYMSEKIYDTYISENQLDILKKDLLKNPDQFSLTNNILSFKDETLLTEVSSIIQTRNGFPEKGMDKTLFYTPIIYYPKDTEFCVFIKTNESEDYLKDIFKYLQYFGIGNRRTVGMNCFRFERIEEVNFKSSQNKLLLSRYIPNLDEVELSQSFYHLSSDIYRSSKEYVGGFVNGKFIHILEGSWMNALEDKEYYGKVIETEVNGKVVHHYAIGFMV